MIGPGLALGAVSAVAHDIELELSKGLDAARAGDYQGALKHWRQLAWFGNAEAQFKLGWVYEAGLGTPQNLPEAAAWYALAAEHGHRQAQYNLGVMHAMGRGVPRDEAKAAEWFHKAAVQGHAKAQYNLSVLFANGRGLRKDAKEAQWWLHRAHENGVLAPVVGMAATPKDKPASPSPDDGAVITTEIVSGAPR